VDPDRRASIEQAKNEAQSFVFDIYENAPLYDYPQEYLEDLLYAIERTRQSGLATPKLRRRCRALEKRIRSYLVEEEEAEDLDEPAPERHNRQQIWSQEFHHPQRPKDASAPCPRRVPAPPSPYVDRVICLHCERYFLGQVIIRTVTCPLCGQGTLIQVGTHDIRTEPWWPFHRKGETA
jgi:hypothetical protein